MNLPAPCDVMTRARASRAKLERHESGKFVTVTQAGADLFA